MGPVTWAVCFAIVCATVVGWGALARPGRPLLRSAAVVLGGAVAVRLAGPALLALVTGGPNWMFEPPTSDEAWYWAVSEKYGDDPRGWWAELALGPSTRYGAVMHGTRLIAYDADPVGIRVINMLLASSGVTAMWAAARRRYGPTAASLPTALAVIWPYAAHHDAAIIREPWMGFGSGWMLLGMTAMADHTGRVAVLGLAGAYLFYLLQPHAGVCVAVAMLFALTAQRLTRLPIWLRSIAVILLLGFLVWAAGTVLGRMYAAEKEWSEYLEGLARTRGGGAAFWSPGPGVPAWMLWACNAVQYWFGLLFIGLGSGARLAALTDYAFWLPIYIYLLVSLRRGNWRHYGAPERFALMLFALYNALSMSYVTNVSPAIRKRNALGLTLLFVLGAALEQRSVAASKHTESSQPVSGEISGTAVSA